jgi:hypothetical protein
MAGFPDGFLTKSLVDACHSGQPGETTDPQNPMKSRNDRPLENRQQNQASKTKQAKPSKQTQ